MDRDPPEKLNFPIAIWTLVLTLGASHLSGGFAPRGPFAKRFSSSLKTFLYEPLGHLFRVEKAKPGSNPKILRKV